MNLTHLYYFRKLAQLEHYTNAAKELYISQPSLSASIAAMEDELSVKLFQKQGRNVRLTKKGREFYHYVCTALDILQDGIAAAQNKPRKKEYQITIAAPSSLLISAIPCLIRNYKNTMEDEDVIFHIEHIQPTAKLLECLEGGKIDCGICINPASGTDYETIVLSHMPVYAILNKHHPLAEADSCTLEDLSDYPIVTFSEQMEGTAPVWEEFHSRNLIPEYAVSDELLISSYLCQRKELVGIGTGYTSAQQSDILRFIPITDLPDDLLQVTLCCPKDLYHQEKLGDFLTYCKSLSQYHVQGVSV